MGMVGIDRLHCAEAGHAADLRPRIETPAFKSCDVVSKKPNAVAVYAQPRAICR
ncbi:hypothetical protein D3C86_2262230 [compost metagenome]